MKLDRLWLVIWVPARMIKFYHTNGEYGFLSNFSRHSIVVDGLSWPTVEHYFQGMKFPSEPERQDRIRRAPTPKDAKAIAWEEGGSPRSDWDEVRDEVMLAGLRAKFTQHPKLKTALLETGDQELAEHT